MVNPPVTADRRSQPARANGLGTRGEGLRLGEALSLDRGDVDRGDEALRVRGKQGKQREVPLHHSTIEALDRYADVRDRCWPQPSTAAFFLSRLGVRLSVAAVHNTFPELAGQAGLEGRGHRARPRPHDLRHYADGWVMCPAVAFPLLAAEEPALQSA